MNGAPSVPASRVLLVGPASSSHLLQWAVQLSMAGHEVHVASLHERLHDVEGVTFWPLHPRAPLGYLGASRSLRSAIDHISPDVVHVHYATGYGTLARRVGRHPYVLSVWGSDVFEFPEGAAWRRRLVVANLRAADLVTSTSQAMTARVRVLGLSSHDVRTVAFGVDPDRFAAPVRAEGQVIVVGTVKSLDARYGIDVLIRAFAHARSQFTAGASGRDLRLVIAGRGPQRQDLEQLVGDLGLAESIEFLGAVAHDDVPALLARFDIFAALSRAEESFGLAVVEAAATGLPSIVTSVGGLGEVVDDGVTGLLVPKEDPAAAARAIVELASNAEMRRRMGVAARERVLERYTWRACVKAMTAAYGEVMFGAHP